MQINVDSLHSPKRKQSIKYVLNVNARFYPQLVNNEHPLTYHLLFNSIGSFNETNIHYMFISQFK